MLISGYWSRSISNIINGSNPCLKSVENQLRLYWTKEWITSLFLKGFLRCRNVDWVIFLKTLDIIQFSCLFNMQGYSFNVQTQCSSLDFLIIISFFVYRKTIDHVESNIFRFGKHATMFNINAVNLQVEILFWFLFYSMNLNQCIYFYSNEFHTIHQVLWIYGLAHR